MEIQNENGVSDARAHEEEGSSSDSEEEQEELENLIEQARSNVIPRQSKHLYEAQYAKYQEWRVKMKLGNEIKEKHLLSYFAKLSETYAATTLWATYTKLKSMIAWKEQRDISKFIELQSFLKNKAKGYKAKKSLVFTFENISKFLNDASDDQFLLHKVVLVIGLHGCLRTIELLNIKIDDVTEQGTMYHIKILKTKTGISKSFVTSPEVHPTIKKYIKLRPNNMERLFLQYRNRTCTRQNVGKGKLSAIPKDIATFLKLENPDKYTGHALRRTSATLAVDKDADIVTLKRLGGWKSSTTAEAYVDESMLNKKTTSKLIASAFDIKKPCETVTSGVNLKNNDVHQPRTSSHHQPKDQSFLEDFEELSSITQLEYDEVLLTQFQNENDTAQQRKVEDKPPRKTLEPKNFNVISSQNKLNENEMNDCRLTLKDYNEFLKDDFGVPEQVGNKNEPKLN